MQIMTSIFKNDFFNFLVTYLPTALFYNLCRKEISSISYYHQQIKQYFNAPIATDVVVDDPN